MISTKGRYAVRVITDLAKNNDGGYIPLKDIAARQEISKKYLEIIVKELVRGGLIAGVSGKGGGYRLCRGPEQYSVGEVLELMEGSMGAVACLDKGACPCPRAENCETLSLWAEYDRMTKDFFYSKKISDLI